MRYSVGAAARATGVAESRLRTWERRYGIPSPGRSDSGRRLYDDADIEVIRQMASLVDRGIPAALAAEAARSGIASAVEEEGPPAAADDPQAAALVEYARQFDSLNARMTVRKVAGELGWGHACDRVLFPALLVAGDAWESGDLSPAHEHFLSGLVQAELLAALMAAPDPNPGAPLVILACAEGEQHDLGLTALWLLLTEAGLRTCYLGANVPIGALVLASRTTEADAVCLGATIATSLPALGQAARALLRIRPAPRVFVGGPIIEREPSSGGRGGIQLPASLTDAAATIVESLRR